MSGDAQQFYPGGPPQQGGPQDQVPPQRAEPTQPYPTGAPYPPPQQQYQQAPPQYPQSPQQYPQDQQYAGTQQYPTAQAYPGAQPYPGAAPVQAGPPPVGGQMKRRNVFAVWIGLPLITLGVYPLVWYYLIHSEMKRFDPRAQISPGGSLCTVMFGWVACGIPPLVSYYNTGTRIANAQRAAGLPQTCAPALGLILNVFFGVGALYYQSELNKVVAHYGNVPPGGPVQLAM